MFHSLNSLGAQNNSITIRTFVLKAAVTKKHTVQLPKKVLKKKMKNEKRRKEKAYCFSNPWKLGSDRHYLLHASMHKW